MSDSTADFPMGRVVTDGLALYRLGQESFFLDIDYSQQNPLPSPVTSARRRCVLVRNTGAGTLAPKLFVTWKAAKAGTEVDAVAGADATVAGQVDPFLNAAVAIDECFWLVVEGPTSVVSSAAITAGATIGSAAAGKVKTSDKSTVALINGAIGKAIETAGGADVTIRALINCRNV